MAWREPNGVLIEHMQAHTDPRSACRHTLAAARRDEAEAFERGGCALVSAAFHVEVDPGIHQEHLHVLGAVRKQVKFDV